MFTRELIQAVSDWQRGGDANKKGARLKNASSHLPVEYRSCTIACYRQEAHDAKRLWQLVADGSLPERIAGWTVDLNVAKSIKGGVPPDNLLGVIFKIMPPEDSVVLNLDKLYRSQDFLFAVEQLKHGVNDWLEGGGRYGGDQHEVVLDLESLKPVEIVSLGGFIGSKEQLLAEDIQNSQFDDAAFWEKIDALRAETGNQWWLSEVGTHAVMDRIEPRLDALREKKRLQGST